MYNIFVVFITPFLNNTYKNYVCCVEIFKSIICSAVSIMFYYYLVCAVVLKSSSFVTTDNADIDTCNKKSQLVT